MKKSISIILSTLIALSAVGSTTAFAVGEKVAPVESGEYSDYSNLKFYSFVNADEPTQMTTIDSSFRYQNDYSMYAFTALKDKSLENKIKSEYASTFQNGSVTADKLSVRYYGILSDGTMVLDINGPFSYTQSLRCTIMDNYVYCQSDSNEFELYKDGDFSTLYKEYENGYLRGELLDETAKLLGFAKFSDKNLLLCGDVDFDGKINVKDATAIQKHLAKMEELKIPSTVLDANSDDEVNIMDSTEIQKYIVG